MAIFCGWGRIAGGRGTRGGGGTIDFGPGFAPAHPQAMAQPSEIVMPNLSAALLILPSMFESWSAV